MRMQYFYVGEYGLDPAMLVPSYCNLCNVLRVIMGVSGPSLLIESTDSAIKKNIWLMY